MTEDIKKCAEKIEALQLMLTGNGNPENSLVFRLRQIEINLNYITDEMKGIDKVCPYRNPEIAAEKVKEELEKDKDGVMIPNAVFEDVLKWIIRLFVLFIFGERVYSLFL